MQTLDIKTITADSPLYPAYFAQVDEPVKQFYARGNLDLLAQADRKRVSIVGSRKVSAYGITSTRTLAQAAARTGITVVSGLAFGVDSIAHQATLDAGGHTIAVLPCGINSIYPTSHEYLAQSIIENNGLLISEYSRSEKPQGYQFIKRNRLIAALSHATVITEAGEKSGSKYTFDFASRLGRELGVVPANIDSPCSKGSNKMLQEGAMPILEPADLLGMFGVNEKLMNSRHSYLKAPSYQSYEQQLILNLLVEEPLSSEELINKTNLTVQKVTVELTRFEIDGVLESIQGKWRFR